MTAPPAGKRGPGRRPGESGTRRAILDAARAQFAAHGWDRATIRAIARDAGVDPALVLHFFGSKAFLFAAAMRWPFDTEAAVEEVLSGPRSELGTRLVSFFLPARAGADVPARGARALRGAGLSPLGAARSQRAAGHRRDGPQARPQHARPAHGPGGAHRPARRRGP